MKLLSWNCRGLGKPSAFRALRNLIKVNCPDVVLLMETKLSESDPKVKSLLSFGPLTNMFMVNCNISSRNRSEGLALIWNNTVNIDILNFNKMIVDCYITPCNDNTHWYATSFYGSPYHNSKHLTCETIKDLAYYRNHDKRLIMDSSEKLGGNDINTPFTSMFNNTLRQYDLNDLYYNRYKFTWANHQDNHNHIQERLDRFCASFNWISYLPRYCNHHLLRYISDRAPIILEFYNKAESKPIYQHHKIKRFEHIWIEDQECKQIIEASSNNSLGFSTDKFKDVLNQLD